MKQLRNILLVSLTPRLIAVLMMKDKNIQPFYLSRFDRGRFTLRYLVNVQNKFMNIVLIFKMPVL